MAFNSLSVFIQLTLCSAEMKLCFDSCVNGVIELCQGQLQQIERQGRRLKVRRFCSSTVCTGFLTLLFQNVFLIGGFGESQFLQAELQDALSYRKVQLRRPDTS